MDSPGSSPTFTRCGIADGVTLIPLRAAVMSAHHQMCSLFFRRGPAVGIRRVDDDQGMLQRGCRPSTDNVPTVFGLKQLANSHIGYNNSSDPASGPGLASQIVGACRHAALYCKRKFARLGPQSASCKTAGLWSGCRGLVNVQRARPETKSPVARASSDRTGRHRLAPPTAVPNE